MKKQCRALAMMLLFCILISSASLCSTASVKNDSEKTDSDGWYYLPAYPNYSPKGLPDFDQAQGNWKGRQGIWQLIGGLWSFCGPTSLADVFWWFDSKHEDPEGFPGDGVDSYLLVREYNAPGVPSPGPAPDDHNFNNVNDRLTPWHHGKGRKEFIEQLAWYCNTNFCRYPFMRGFAGTYAYFLEKGAQQWIDDAGLHESYRLEAVWKPDFSLIVSHLQHNDGVIVNFLFYNPKATMLPTFLGHYVAVAGIHPNGSIALCDPFQNMMNPDPSPRDHNDASVVSYDVYPVDFTSPFPKKASWWITQYFDLGIMKLGGLAQYALIISEVP